MNNNITGQINPARLKNLLKALVDIYSPSGKEEEILEYLEDYLKQNGLFVVRQKIDENRYNLLVLPENEDEIDVLYIGHVDTVSAYDLDNFGFTEQGDIIRGLGTADMKAGCAAMIEAFTVLASRGRAPDKVALALVSGEEEDNSGARELMKQYNFPWALIGEPSNLVPCLGHYAYLEVILRTQGKRAHSATPEQGHNAIESMLKMLLKFTSYAADNKHGLVYNLRELSGFPGGFVVPDACEAYLDIHLPPNSRIDVIKAELEQMVQSSMKENHGMDASLWFEDTYSGYRIAGERTIVQKLQSVLTELKLPWEPQDFRSHSDANILWTAGVDSIILGPGRLEDAHSPNESVTFSQTLKAAEVYLKFAQSL